MGGRGSSPTVPSRNNTRPRMRARRIIAPFVVFVVALASGSCSDSADNVVALDGSSTTTSTSSELPEVVDEWVEALLAGDAEAVAQCYAEDGVWVDHGHPMPRKLQQPSIAGGLSAAFPYLTLTEITLLSEVRTADAFLTEWRWSGTSSNHSRAATDQTPFTAEVEFLFTFDDDLIETSEFSYDYDSVFN